MVKILNFDFFNQVVHFITHGRIGITSLFSHFLYATTADKKIE
jgi:hypothetical protein